LLLDVCGRKLRPYGRWRVAFERGVILDAGNEIFSFLR
jgi:hypothetical protein